MTTHAESAGASSVTYSAFISYRWHETDRAWAEWLQTVLERYRPPRSLRKSGTITAELPLRVFRDKTEMPAGGSLPDRLREALEKSRFLVVVCSPRAATPGWMDQEIDEFLKGSGAAERILPFNVEGDPPHTFPESLRRLRRPGEASTEYFPIAADVAPQRGSRPSRQRRLAVLQVAAPILGVPLAQLLQRDAERRTRRMISWSTVLTAIALVMTGLALAAIRQRDDAVKRFGQVRELANTFVFGFYDRIEQVDGALEARQFAAQTAQKYLDLLYLDNRSDPALERELAVAYYKLGRIQSFPGEASFGKTPPALANLRRSTELFEHVLAGPAPTVQFRRNAAIAMEHLADVLTDSGSAQEADQWYRRAMDLRERLAAEEPTDVDVQADLGSSVERAGNTKRDRGEYEAALKEYARALGIIRPWADAPDASADVLLQASVTAFKVGDVCRTLKRFADAKERYQESLDLARTLAKRWPEDRRVHRNLMASLQRRGNVFLSEKKMSESLADYREALEVAKQMAASEPNDIEAQLDLGIAHEKVGDALVTMSNGSGALEAYTSARGPFERAATINPDSRRAARGRLVLVQRFGETYLALGRMAEAIDAYQQSVTMARVALQRDPSGVQAAEDVGLAEYQLASALEPKEAEQLTPQAKAERWGQAVVHYTRAREAFAPLLAANTLNPDYTSDVEDLPNVIAKCQKQAAVVEGGSR
ncbi:MAG: toll/interleukin-1 receptor domain-containing protein [Phycisphaerales bacterium]|nr:toll/interleukin-1 receptor domain-containing protein [Phycisphaerales bacterium]